jgi:hypothetical protein
MATKFTWAQAAHNRDAAKDNEVSFKKGDVLKVFQKYPNGWWVAENNGKMGVCPGSWLRDLSEQDALALIASRSASTPTPTAATASTIGMARAQSATAVNTSGGGSGTAAATATAAARPMGSHQSASVVDGSSTTAAQSSSTTAASTGNSNRNSSSGSKRRSSRRHPLFTVVALHDYRAANKDELSFRRGDRITISKEYPNGWLRGELDTERGLVPATYVQREEANLDATATAPVATAAPPTNTPTLLPPGAAVGTIAPAPTAQPKATDVLLVAKYSFEASDDRELTFKAGDIIKKLEEYGEWWKGEVNGNVGYFPANYVELYTASTQSSHATSTATAPAVPTAGPANSPSSSSSTNSAAPVAASSAAVSGAKASAAPPPTVVKRPSDATSTESLCFAIYDYQASNAGEISLSAGQVLALKAKLASGWAVGRAGDAVGYFPLSYVKELDRETAAKLHSEGVLASREASLSVAAEAPEAPAPHLPSRNRSSTTQPTTERAPMPLPTADKAPAATERAPMPLPTADKAPATTERAPMPLPTADKAAPAATTTPTMPNPNSLPPAPKRPGEKLVIATHDYTARSETEISFKKGEIFVLKRPSQSGWCLCTHNGRDGYAPENRVKAYEPKGDATAADDRETHHRRLTEEAERARKAADEAEQKRLTQEAEHQRLAAEAERKRLAAEEAENKRLAIEARYAEEAEQKRLAEEAKRLQAERERQEAEDASERERQAAEAAAAAAAAAEEERRRHAEAEAEAERKRQAEAHAAAEAEKQRDAQAAAAAEEERRRQAAEAEAAAAEEERRRHAEAAAAAADAERRRKEEQEAVEAEHRRQAAEAEAAAAEEERKRHAEAEAAAESERKRHAEAEAAAESERKHHAEAEAAAEEERKRHAEAEATAEEERKRHAEAESAAEEERTRHAAAEAEAEEERKVHQAAVEEEQRKQREAQGAEAEAEAEIERNESSGDDDGANFGARRSSLDESGRDARVRMPVKRPSLSNLRGRGALPPQQSGRKLPAIPAATAAPSGDVAQELNELRALVQTLQAQIPDRQQLAQRLEASERVQSQQAQRIAALESELSMFSAGYTSGGTSASASRESTLDDDLGASSTTPRYNPQASEGVGAAAVLFASSPAEVTTTQLADALTREFNLRREMESVICKLDTQVHSLSRAVHKLQRELNEQQTLEQFGQHKLRPVGRDLTR